MSFSKYLDLGRFSSRRLATQSLLAALLSLTGCGSGLFPIAYSDASAITGNWQISSTSTYADKLPQLSGQLTGSKASVSGVVHPDSSTTCVAPETVIALSGLAGADRVVTLTGKLGGGTLTITGKLAADGRTLDGATYNVAGGNCAFSGVAEATTAQSYSPIEGTYAGKFTDVNGYETAFTIDLAQALSPDANGDFMLTGSSSLINNVCFSGLIQISHALVTGESFTLTYSDAKSGDSVTVDGTLSTDAATLTVTKWVLTGPCGATNGTGTLVRQ